MLPVLAGRRNGRLPTSGENDPIAIPGNVSLVDAVALNGFVTSAARYVYENATRHPCRTCASTDNSIPSPVVDCELAYAPNPVALAAAGGMPIRISCCLLRNSSRSSYVLWKYVTRTRIRPRIIPCSTPTSIV